MLTVILSVFSEQINAGKTSEPDTTPALTAGVHARKDETTDMPEP